MQAKLVVNDIAKTFVSERGSLPVLNGISFAVAAGEMVAIVGPSGCGKSTLMNIVAGFERPDRGYVEVDGRRRDKPGRQAILISQYGSVFPWMTVRENVMFGLNGHPYQDKQALADRYAALVGLQGFERMYPHELSGGMLKRTELARALIVKPDILFMDEPFAALDALMRLRMRNELLRILANERPTVLLVTHDIEEAIHLANRVIVLSSQPTRIRATFEVPFPHPRRLSLQDTQELRNSILRELGVTSYGTDSLVDGVDVLRELD